MNKLTRFLRAARIGLPALLLAGCSILLMTPQVHFDKGNTTQTSYVSQVYDPAFLSSSKSLPSLTPSSPPGDTGQAIIASTGTIIPANQNASQLPVASPTRFAPLPTLTVTIAPTATASPTPGSVENITLPASAADISLSSLLVYLPPGYDTQTSRRYPVLYLLHGQGDNDDQWVRMGIADVADRLINSGVISPLIIVMPNEENSTSLPENTSFGDDLATVLVPWIDSQFRTLPNRADRAIGGLSRGASWAMRLGLIYWQTFGAIGAHSYPMFYGDGALIPKWLDAIPPDDYPSIYLDIGNKDPGLQIVKDFEAYLTSRGIPHEYHLNVGYHEEKYWAAHLEDYLRWYNSAW